VECRTDETTPNEQKQRRKSGLFRLSDIVSKLPPGVPVTAELVVGQFEIGHAIPRMKFQFRLTTNLAPLTAFSLVDSRSRHWKIIEALHTPLWLA
jgi:hypothetical protein